METELKAWLVLASQDYLIMEKQGSLLTATVFAAITCLFAIVANYYWLKAKSVKVECPHSDDISMFKGIALICIVFGLLTFFFVGNSVYHYYNCVYHPDAVIFRAMIQSKGK